jgi:SAM-dependent methyltransferase
MKIDFEKTAADYGQYRAGFPNLFFERLFALGHVRSGDRALDLGTGVGTVARGLALRGCNVIGLDPSQALIEEGQRLDQAAGVAVRYVIGTAEETGLPSAAFDVVTAGQCWHWFDRMKAPSEVRRILRPEGVLIIAHFDWLPLPGNVVEATERLILVHNPAWKGAGGTGVYPKWLVDAAVTGFENIETFSFDVAVPYSHVAWRGRIRARSAGVAASLPPDAVAKFDTELAALLVKHVSADLFDVPHRVWALTCRAPS